MSGCDSCPASVSASVKGTSHEHYSSQHNNIGQRRVCKVAYYQILSHCSTHSECHSKASEFLVLPAKKKTNYFLYVLHGIAACWVNDMTYSASHHLKLQRTHISLRPFSKCHSFICIRHHDRKGQQKYYRFLYVARQNPKFIWSNLIRSNANKSMWIDTCDEMGKKKHLTQCIFVIRYVI